MKERQPGRLPEFIAVGPPRTATTWLDAVLRGHVGLPEGTKETHFFTRSYSNGLAWYRSHFAYCPPQLQVGEICTSYFRSSTARGRISTDIPGCKIICSLRDPTNMLRILTNGCSDMAQDSGGCRAFRTSPAFLVPSAESGLQRRQSMVPN